MRPGTGDGLAACTGGGLAACTSSTCSRNCLVSSCRFSLRKSRGKCTSSTCSRNTAARRSDLVRPRFLGPVDLETLGYSDH